MIFNYTFPSPIGGLNLKYGERTTPESDCRAATNVELTRVGVIQSANGYTRLNASALAGRVTGLYLFRKALSTEYFLATAGTNIYTVNRTNGTTSNVYSSLTTNLIQYFSTFNDLCVISNGTDAPLKYDGSTVSTLSGWTTIEATGKFKFSAVWKNRLWVAGTANKPYRLYWSEPGTPEGWNTGSGAGSVDVNINDGEVITGIYPFFDTLLIFKENSIHQLTGDSVPGSGGPNEFKIRPINTVRQCTSPRTIVPAGNNLLFLDKFGVGSTEATNVFGSSAVTANTLINDLSIKVLPEVEQFSTTAINDFFAVPHPIKNQIWFCYTTSGSENDKVLVLDYSLNAWFQRSGFSASCGCNIGTSIYLGDYDGYINRHDYGSNYNGGAIEKIYDSAWSPLVKGNYSQSKRIRSIDHTVYAYTNHTMQVYGAWDFREPVQSYALSIPSNTSGSTWGSATWGTSRWSTSTNRQVRRIGDFGYGKVFSQRLYNNGADQPFQVLGTDIMFSKLGYRTLPEDIYS